eukprot:jgi/Galph1/3997/GphlegSOOS_G2648.1
METSRDSSLSFSLSGDASKVLFDALCCLSMNSNKNKRQIIWILQATRGGLKLVVEEDATFQASVLIRENGFCSLEFSDSFVGVCVFLVDLVDGLSILGLSQNSQSGTSSLVATKGNILRLIYVSEGDPIFLILHDLDFVTQCRLKTLEFESPVDFSFFASSVLCSAILSSEYLREAFLEVDVPGTEAVKIHVKRDIHETSLIVESCGRSGNSYSSASLVGVSVSVELASNSDVETDLFAEFHVSEDFTQVIFPVHFIRRCIRALSISDTCRLRINENGMLSLVSRLGTNQKPSDRSNETLESYCFIEHLVLPLECI